RTHLHPELVAALTLPSYRHESQVIHLPAHSPGVDRSWRTASMSDACRPGGPADPPGGFGTVPPLPRARLERTVTRPVQADPEPRRRSPRTAVLIASRPCATCTLLGAVHRLRLSAGPQV